MTTPDISRFLRQRIKRYAGVRLQQGRILTDADFNERSWLREEDRRLGLLDFVGRRGSPDLGFSICQPLNLDVEPPDLAEPLRPEETLPAQSFELGGVSTPVRPVSIQTGSFYLGGRRFELEQPQPFMFQRDFLQMGAADIPPPPENADDPVRLLYLLNAWEQDVGVVEDREFREPALGGSETSVRVRRMRRVEVKSVPAGRDCAEAFNEIMFAAGNGNTVFQTRTGELASTGRLQLIFDPTVTGTSCFDCNPTQAGPYLGADNQTLRVMLTDPDHFVWALDNAAPLYRAKVSNLGASNPSEVRVTLLTPPPVDEEHIPLRGRVIEILPFAALLDGSEPPGLIGDDLPHFNKAAAELGAFSRVIEPYDPESRSFLIDPTAPGIGKAATFVHTWDPDHPDAERLNVPDGGGGGGEDDERFFYVRFWHVSTAADLGDVEIPLDADGFGPFLGATAVQPVFRTRGNAGDFWTAAIRPETPDPIVPAELRTNTAGVAPDGPRHFYAPLALLQITSDQVDAIMDCRPRMRPTGDDECSTVTVGNCFGSIGDFTTIAEAIDALPTDGGVVTIRPGLYRERVVIDRPGVILEGCGENTVLLSPDNGDGETVNALIRLQGNCRECQVRSMRLETSEECAIIATGAQNLGLGALHVVGRVTEVGSSSSSSTETATTDLPLVHLVDCGPVTLQAIQVDAQRRPAFLLESCGGVAARALTLRGSYDVFKAPAAPMITLQDSANVRMQDVVIETFGQAGVVVRGDFTEDIELARFTIDSQDSKVEPVIPPLAGFDLDGVRDVRVTGSRITMTVRVTDRNIVSPHAGIVAFGQQIWIEDNRIDVPDASKGRAGPRSWGGIQVRSLSSGVVIRGNHVNGGIGHGITLGSVIWSPVGGGGDVLPHQGAGKNIISIGTPDLGYAARGDFFTFVEGTIEYKAFDGGTLSDIAILNNRIQGMSSNGISTLTVLGLEDVFNGTADHDLPVVERLRIDGNVITGNLIRPVLIIFTSGQENLITEANPRSPVGAMIPALPSGGIVLATVGESAEIRGNVIQNNNTSATHPVCGVFILNGEGISISGNRIQNNGGLASANVTPDRGVRAGIAVMLAGTGTPSSFGDLQETLFQGGNTLANDGSSVRITRNVVMQPEGRALHLVAAGPVAISGNFLSSNGFHGSENPEDEFAIGDVVLVENVGGPWERWDIAELPFNGSVFTDYPATFEFAKYLLNAVTASPRFFVGTGGQVLFQDNQVIYDWQIKRNSRPDVPLGIFPVALLTLDHLGIIGNHFGLRITNIPAELSKPDPDLPDSDPSMPVGTDNVRSTPMLTHVFAAAGSLHVAGNRVAESIVDTLLSIWGLGEMTTLMTSNQTAHQNFARANHNSGNNRLVTVADNQVVFSENNVLSAHSGERDLSFFTNFNLHLFFHLLFRPASAGPPPPPPG
jgi:hypothetical protein